MIVNDVLDLILSRIFNISVDCVQIKYIVVSFL